MENRGKKKIFIIIALLLFSVANINAQIDTRTQNKIKAKFLTAQELYDNKEYTESLEKVNEIEKLTDGKLLAAAQNLKVKCLIGQEKYIKAKEELYTLEGLNLSSDIIKDISSYSSKIENYIEAEKEKNKQIISKIKLKLGPKSVEAIKTWDIKKLWGFNIDNKFGYINSNFEIIIPFEYEDGYDRIYPEWNYLPTKLNGKWGIIDRTNHVVITHKYEAAYKLGNKDFFQVKKNGKLGIVDKNEKMIADFIYDEIWQFFGNLGIAFVKLNGKWGSLNERGEIVIDIKYDDLDHISTNDILEAELNGKKGKIDRKGNIVEPFK
ncbi:WG repeat-containing protein [Polaribacter aestuariivivens]|uniref:WG repeat-containing protein n=1 Tax=Polaribacter aestuariivivens TaxID=2304626 RepID=A0A5S3N3F1_9FLAO|nr:WG repeat-containing protein [Polaribacter aestuariivivens]TMM29851.1 WG repeat-containing protein [Polaribacter aestuariivivens]